MRHETYEKAVNDSMGWCTDCGDFTRDCTEPDAENYDCPVCGEKTVMGAEQAMISGAFEVK
uniref:Uncharacterized protein n=1 Tax=viral metagenome TaxID=1070528 RepID=A0A6H2A3F9_9ZZZZ